MAVNNAINLNNANFSPNGNWSFNGTFSLPAISSSPQSNILFYDTATKLVSYGVGGSISDYVVDAFSTSGSFTPSPLCKVMIVELFGAGGGGGGAPGLGSPTYSAGGGGGSGAYARLVVLPPDIAFFSYNVGSAGTGGSGNGGDGGDTSAFGVTANGGSGALVSATYNVSSGSSDGGAGGTVSGSYGVGMISIPGNAGSDAFISLISASLNNSICASGAGGNGPLYYMGGPSVIARTAQLNMNGVPPASGICAGGSGAAVGGGTTTSNGANGGSGYIIITQLI